MKKVINKTHNDWDKMSFSQRIAESDDYQLIYNKKQFLKFKEEKRKQWIQIYGLQARDPISFKLENDKSKHFDCLCEKFSLLRIKNQYFLGDYKGTNFHKIKSVIITDLGCSILDQRDIEVLSCDFLLTDTGIYDKYHPNKIRPICNNVELKNELSSTIQKFGNHHLENSEEELNRNNVSLENNNTIERSRGR